MVETPSLQQVGPDFPGLQSDLSACLLRPDFLSQRSKPVAGTFTLHHLSIVRPVTIKGSQVGALLFEVSLAELNRLTLSLIEVVLLATLCASLFALLSHELRTPLNAIIGYSEMLYEDAQDPSQEDMKSDLSKILSSARHLLAVISDVLDLSKIEAGQMKVYLEELPVILTVNDVLPIAEALVKNSRNTSIVNDEAKGATTLVDALRFRQCLLNLISNACKFTKEGTITFGTSMREKQGAPWVVWSVEDTGIGIAAESLPNLFRASRRSMRPQHDGMEGRGWVCASVKNYAARWADGLRSSLNLASDQSSRSGCRQ